MAATREQLAMIQTRYCEAARLGRGKRVLEVACGPGRGLGLLAREAATAVGGDLTYALVAEARDHYRGRVPVLQFDAEALPFADRSFDLVVLFEAIYYLPHPQRFVDEAARVLVPGGSVLVSSANRESPHFLGSRYSTEFLNARELTQLFARHGFSVDLRAGFVAMPPGRIDRAAALVRREAARLGLVPDTLVAREKLKKLFCGPLSELGPEVVDGTPVESLVPIDVADAPSFKILYVLATRT